MLHFAPWKIIVIALTCFAGVLFAHPNLYSSDTVRGWPDFLPKSQLSLGLDLQGGSHLLLDMNTDELMDPWMKAVRDDVRTRLRDARIRYTNLRQTNANVTVQIPDATQVARAMELLELVPQPLEGSLLGGATGRDLDLSNNGGRIALEPSQGGLDQRVNGAISSAIETIRNRVDELGTTEPTIQRQGRKRILVQVPGFDDPEALKRIVGRTATLSFREVDSSYQGQGRARVGWVAMPSRDQGIIAVKDRPVVSGEELVDAQPSFDQRTNEPIVTFRFNQSGARKFGRYSQANIGRPFAIVLDDTVISAPVIRDAILGGSGQISGGFTVEQVNELAILLRSGALPASLDIVEERTVGASLGEDSVAAGQMAGVIGLIGVIAFIIMTYGIFGVFATAALAINIVLLMGALSALGATLTLPGIAGIVLTIGMAVDANVLIYERIREELRQGKSSINAIETGYSRALGTILDANITTFIAAIILFWLGSGPIRGFAVTLSIGIFTSVFTAFVLSRLFVVLWLRSQKSQRNIDVPI